ncbi:multicopper oxidase domain-containing protein [Skermanella pratensis]|uniref:multicopper oxidase domain-containing protein n=1 Tax=Skermanella pratensis TaxID=2233999 RepID=UPI0013013F2B|nr:multicopper oxidase domain-containing protein [Skermanella pratensis]
MRRREFLKYGSAMAAFATVSTSLPAILSAQTSEDAPTGEKADFDLEIVDVDVELIDGSVVPMYAFAPTGKTASIPGPILRVTQGDTVRIDIRNSSTRPHGFQIVGQSNAVVSGLAPADGDGEDKTRIEFVATKPGTYFYVDGDNSPINRVLGLYGALIVEPKNGYADGAAKKKPMPYAPGAATPAMKSLFTALGEATIDGKPARFPGKPWQKEREYVWIFNQIDPVMCRRIGGGELVTPAEFESQFHPRYFTINGLCGLDSAHDKATCPTGRAGEPALIRCMNAGLATHSPHIHGNHVFVLTESNKNGLPVYQTSLNEHDVWTMPPMMIKDVLLPFTTPPDVPPAPWRMVQEKYPLRYPMHCHNEISQTSAGGSYPMGLVTDWHIDGPVATS